MRAAEIALLLPDVYRRSAPPGSVLAGILAALEELHAPSEAALASFPEALDPLTTPDRFVPLLAAWVDLARLDAPGPGRPGVTTDRLRQLVHLAGVLGRARGTAEGLVEVVRVATGVAECRVVTTGPFAVRVELPGATPAQLDLARVVVEQEKPAHLVVWVDDGSPDGPGAAGGLS